MMSEIVTINGAAVSIERSAFDGEALTIQLYRAGVPVSNARVTPAQAREIAAALVAAADSVDPQGDALKPERCECEYAPDVADLRASGGVCPGCGYRYTMTDIEDDESEASE